MKKKILALLISALLFPQIAMGQINVYQGGTGKTSFPAGGIIVGDNAFRLTSTTSPTVGYITATSTTATSTFPNISFTTAVDFLGDYVTNGATWIRSKISETITGISYNSATGVFSLSAGYEIPLTASTTHWEDAYGWGDHSLEGYLTTESDPIWVASSTNYYTKTEADANYDSLGQATSTMTDHTSTYNHANYDTAYGWGDHGIVGYLTSLTPWTENIDGGGYYADNIDYITATGTSATSSFTAISIGTTTSDYALDVEGSIRTDTAFRGDYWISATGNSMNIQPSGDTDDFFSFKTPVDRPTIKREGGKYIYIESSNVNDVGISFRKDADHSGTINYYKDTEEFGLTSKDPLVFKVSEDYDDYIKIITANNIPELSVASSSGFKINAGGTNDLLLNHDGGNIGFGTSSTAYPFDFYGNARIDGTLTMSTPITDANVSDTLTVTGYMQDGDINTFAELNAWIIDGTLASTTHVWNDAYIASSTEYLVDNNTMYTATYPVQLVGTAFGLVSASTTEWDSAFSWGDWSGEGFITNAVSVLSSLVSVGTIGTGVWEATAIDNAYIASSTEYLADNDTTYVSSDFTHDDLTGFVANEHLDWTADLGAVNIHSGNYTDTNTTYTAGDFLTLTATDFDVDATTTISNGDTTHLASADTIYDWGVGLFQTILTNSAGLLAALDDETGTGVAVFNTSPTLVTPALGTPSALVGTNITGTALGFTVGSSTALATARTIAGVSFDGTANIAIPSTGLSDTADLLYEAELNTFSELQTQIADETLLKAGTLTDTKYCIYDSASTDIICDSEGGSGAEWTDGGIFLYPTETTDTVIVGGNATTTTGSIFEVIGTSTVDRIHATTGSKEYPSYSFKGDTDHGFYALGTDNIRYSASGNDILQFSVAGLKIVRASSNIQVDNYYFDTLDIAGSGDTNTGIGWNGSDVMFFTTGGTKIMTFDASQQVGIGTTTPSALLTVGATSTEQFLVSDLGVITDGVWNGTAIDNAYIASSTEYLADTNTNANTICAGGTTYLDGEGNCDDISSVYQPLEATLTDIADGTINENLVNTANPWADNEVSDTLTCSNVVSASGVINTTEIEDNGITYLDWNHTGALAGNLAMESGQCTWGANGVLCEGATANIYEALLTVTDPTADRTYTFPDSDITVAGLASAMTGTFDGNNFAGDTIGQGDILYGSAAGAISELAKDTNATRYLSNTGASNNPAWAQINLTNGVTGTLPVGSGGTGATTLTDHGVLVGSGTAVTTALAVGTNGQLLIGSTGADPVFATLNCDYGLTCTTGAGTLEIDADTASDTVVGAVELATIAETTTGTDTSRAVTPDGLAGSTIFGRKTVELIPIAFDGDTAVADGVFYFHIPASLNGMNLVSVHGLVVTAGTTGTTDWQVYNLTDTQDMLSTKLTIDTAETGSNTAATPAVINTTYDDVATNDVLRLDCDAIATTAAKGTIITLEFQLP